MENNWVNISYKRTEKLWKIWNNMTQHQITELARTRHDNNVHQISECCQSLENPQCLRWWQRNKRRATDTLPIHHTIHLQQQDKTTRNITRSSVHFSHTDSCTTSRHSAKSVQWCGGRLSDPTEKLWYTAVNPEQVIPANSAWCPQQ